MNFPSLTIPDIALPFAVPHMIHPLLVHFAIALPVLIILFEIVNFFIRKRAVGVTSFMLILLLVAVYIGTYFTGITDAEEAAKLLSPEAKEVLGAHKQLGIYLVYGSLVVLLFKLISSAVNKFPARLVFLLVLIGFALLAFNEGQKGGELVYKHGVNVQVATSQASPDTNKTETTNAVSSAIEKSKETAQKALDEAKEKMSEVKEKVEQATEKAKEKTQEAVTKTQEAAQSAVEEVKEKASEATEKAKESVEKTVETVKEEANEVKEKTKEAIEKAVTPATEAPVKKITPIETVPAG